VTDGFTPTLEAARARIAAVRPTAYAQTRNALDGAVTGLSPYITHGFVSLPDVLADVNARHALNLQHKFVFELGWRDYFRHVWQHRAEGILSSLHEGPLPDAAYDSEVPHDIRQACTGVPVIDMAVHTLYATGMLHNHARMWLASYVVHVRKVHWRAGADWLYGHLLDGDLASNHLSWQWVAGTGSRKPYLFNADNVARHASAAWHSPGSVIDTCYDALDHLARHPGGAADPPRRSATRIEPELFGEPPAALDAGLPNGPAVNGRDVWLVHPWCLGELPATLPADTLVVGIVLADFHRGWPWSATRWRFVGSRMRQLTGTIWHGDAVAMGHALANARTVRSIAEPHLMPWLPRWAECAEAPMMFPAVDGRCDSFSSWWARACRGPSLARTALQGSA
jgi:deoxyribodipyrimidine photo-lyase